MFKRKLNQQGDAIAFVLLAIVVIAVGGLFYWKYQQVNKDVSKVDTSVPKASEKKKTETKPVNTTNYLVIKEWGVKFKSDEAIYINYEIHKGTVEEDSLYDDGPGPYEEVSFKFNEKFPGYGSTNNECSDPGAGIRRVPKDRTVTRGVKVIGDYKFFTLGAPGACNGSEQQKIQQKILMELNDLDNNLVSE